MRKLPEQEIERIISLLQEGKPLQEDYKSILFETKNEYELKVKEQIMVIYIDIFGNEKREVKTLKDFKK
jgi:hypothetical protein